MASNLLPFRVRSSRPQDTHCLPAEEQALLQAYRQLALTLDELFEEIFFSYNRYLAIYLRRRQWDEATVEDILQSAWMILWNDLKQGTFFQRSAGRGRVRNPMLAFLVKTCENLARNIRRHVRDFPRVSLDEVGPHQMVEPVRKEISQAETRLNYGHIMDLALRVCTADERCVLDLLALGLDRCEIAEITGHKPHWVDNRWRAACRKIRAGLVIPPSGDG